MHNMNVYACECSLAQCMMHFKQWNNFYILWSIIMSCTLSIKSIFLRV